MKQIKYTTCSQQGQAQCGCYAGPGFHSHSGKEKMGPVSSSVDLRGKSTVYRASKGLPNLILGLGGRDLPLILQMLREVK